MQLPGNSTNDQERRKTLKHQLSDLTHVLLRSVEVAAESSHLRNISILPQILQRWLNYGASLQVTAASLAGCFGSVAERAAWDMVLGGWATIVATDAHDTGRNGPCMTIAAKLLADALGPHVARRLCRENPLRIVGGAEPLPVRSLDRQEVG